MDLFILAGNEDTYKSLDEFEFWPDFNNYNDSSEKSMYNVVINVTPSTLIGFSSFLQVTRTTIHF